MQLALTDLGPTKHFKRDQKVLKHKQTTKRFKCIQLTANTDKCKGEVKALVDNPNVAGTTIKQASLEFLDLQLPPTCPVENLVYELNYLSEALSSCSADHLEGNFHFIHHHSFIHQLAQALKVCPCSSWFQFLVFLRLGTVIRKEKGKNF